jgi:hypothetical protein
MINPLRLLAWIEKEQAKLLSFRGLPHFPAQLTRDGRVYARMPLLACGSRSRFKRLDRTLRLGEALVGH